MKDKETIKILQSMVDPNSECVGDTQPSEVVGRSVLLVQNDKKFICVHHKEDYFSGEDNYDEITYHETEISRFDTQEEMLEWIELIEATHSLRGIIIMDEPTLTMQGKSLERIRNI